MPEIVAHSGPLPEFRVAMAPQRVIPWVLRAVWAVLPFTAGPAFADALAERSGPVQDVASIGLWAAWAVVLVATLVPHPVSLTVVRCAAPGAVAAALFAALDASGSPLAVSTTALALAVALLPETGTAFVNGPAYPGERRFLLRAPTPLLVGVLGVVWALATAPLAAGPLLLAARQWLPGALVLAVGVPLSVVLFRAMHGLSRRGRTPATAGVVLHDHMALADPVLFRRQVIARLGPAPAGTDALDLTQTAPGLGLELTLTEEVSVVRSKPGQRLGEPATATRVLVTPTRPGAVLREAAERGLPVG